MARIVVLATGGTIAGQAAHAGDGVAYQAAQIGVEDLLRTIPGVQDALGTHTLLGEQVAQVNSKDMDFAIWQALALRCAHWLEQPDVRALVLTHGTDTLEETAFFLQLALTEAPGSAAWRDKPVVLTCAMRPATARLSDGPQNMADALALACSEQARGVMMVEAGQVHAADAVQKIHPYRLNAFSSGDAGPLAHMEEGQVRWLRPPTGWPQPALAGLWPALHDVPPAHWPWVEVLHTHAGADARGLHALIQAGVHGVVLAATGNASLHHILESAVHAAPTEGLRVVQAPRCTASAVVRSPASAPDPVPLIWYSTGPNLAPLALPVSKARVWLLLQLLAQQAGTMHPAA